MCILVSAVAGSSRQLKMAELRLRCLSLSPSLAGKLAPYLRAGTCRVRRAGFEAPLHKTVSIYLQFASKLLEREEYSINLARTFIVATERLRRVLLLGCHGDKATFFQAYRASVGGTPQEPLATFLLPLLLVLSAPLTRYRSYSESLPLMM